MSADDPEYLVHVLIQQTRFFGPFPDSYEDFITLEQNQALAAIMYAIADEGSRKPFILAQDKELTEGDKRFIWKIMQMDPRDRPTAKELLEDEWFDQP
jgi:casein kinase II subunit alpha